MVFFRFGEEPKYNVLIVSSPSLSPHELEERILKIMTKLNLAVEPRVISFVTQDGRRTEGRVLDSEDLVPHLRLLMAIRKIGKDVRIHSYSYSDRFDSPELEIPAPTPDAIRDSLKAIVGLAFDYLKEAFVEGWINPGTIRSAAELILLACQWGSKASEEVMGLLLGRLLQIKNVSSPNDHLLRAFEKLKISLEDTDAVRHIASLISRGQHHSDSLDADIACWKDLVRALLAKNWEGRSNSFSEMGEQFFHGSYYEGRFLWLLDPYRDRILRYAADPEINLDEFMDLATLVPPTGYTVLRRLSNTSAFKVVYRSLDVEGKRVALKRYKSWESERLKQLLARLGLTKEGMIQKDALTHWLGEIRHTHILPCMLVKNEKSELFIVEPLLDGTLDSVCFEEPGKIIRLIREVCEALDFLHQKKWIHSDIKPDNIGIERETAVLLDFGIASLYSLDPRARSNPGSIKTRAPELFSKTAAPTFASDVWAMGANLMALASRGEYPFLHKEEVETLPPAGDLKRVALENKILDRIHEYRLNPPHFEERIQQVIPGNFQSILEPVLSATKLNPADRPSARGLIELLDRAMWSA